MSGETILIVDDEPTIVEVVGLYLQREGYKVLTAGDGAAALDIVEQQRPDLVVLDLMLPGIGGLDVTRRLRAAGALPIILLTARTEEADRVVGQAPRGEQPGMRVDAHAERPVLVHGGPQPRPEPAVHQPSRNSRTTARTSAGPP